MNTQRNLRILIFLLGSSLFLCSCGFFAPRNINRLKPESPLLEIVKPEGYDYNDTKIRDAVLKQLPIGAARQQIEAFLSRNFVDASYSVTSKPLSRALYQPNDPHVFIRPVEISNSAGGERVEIYLLLDHDEHLKDVVVKSYRSYM